MRKYFPILVLVGFWAGVLAGCSPKQESRGPAADQAAAGSEAFESTRGMSRRYLDPKSTAHAWIDGRYVFDALLKSKLLDSIVSSIKLDQRAEWQKFRNGCGYRLLGTIQEVAFSVSDAGRVTVMRTEASQREVAECLTSLGLKKAEVGSWSPLAGHDFLFVGDLVLVRDGDFLVAADREHAEAVFQRPRWETDALKAETVVLVESSKPDRQIDRARVEMARVGSRTHLNLKLVADSEDFARKTEASVRQTRDRMFPVIIQRMNDDREKIAAAVGLSVEQYEARGMKKEVQAMMDSFQFHRAGRNLSASIEVDTEVLFGAGLAMAVYGVRKYVTSAKMAEAKQALGRITGDVLLYYRGELPGGADGVAGRLPPSGRAVPAEVPRGEKIQTSAEDWNVAGWKDIGFVLSVSIYYSYELVVADDGKSFVVYARGDLDGDGKQSEFSQGGHIELVNGKNVLRLDPTIKEKDPEE